MARPGRVAVTLEQCWHRVPGGTAVAALGSVRAVAAAGGVEQIGVAAAHRRPPADAFRPPIEVRQLPLPRPALYEAWHRLRRPAVERVTGPVDVIHATGMAVPPRTAPLVVTVHDLDFLAHPERSTRRGLRFFRRAVELARAEADVVVAPSQATIDACVAEGFDPARLRLVPWGIAIDPAGPDEVRSARRRHGLVRPYVLWTGTLEPRKNLPALLAAFAGLDRHDVDLVLVGPSGWNEDVGALVAPLDQDRVHLLGFVEPGELRALYAGSDVFCLPSAAEGFGLPVLEAMAQGAPVVTSAGTATAEVVGSAGRCVDPHDVAALRRALDEVLEDRTLARSLGEAGRRRAATFTWERTAAGLVDAYREAAGGPAASVTPGAGR